MVGMALENVEPNIIENKFVLLKYLGNGTRSGS